MVSEAQVEDGCKGEFVCTSDPESPDKAIETDDRIPPSMVAEIRASQTTFQRLAQAFAANSAPKSFWDAVPHHLQDFEDVFSKASFDTLPERK
ncbi:hypothetical protein C0992_009915, partial [Termitomyces sp. T32_za158]